MERLLNFNKTNLGFKKRKILKNVGKEIKGVPIIFYNDTLSVVAKIIPVDLSQDDDNSFVEIKMLLYFKNDLQSHPNITNLIFFKKQISNQTKGISRIISKFDNSKIRPFSRIAFYEYYPEGDIDSWSHGKIFSEDTWKSVLFQVIKIIEILQKRYRFIHNDLHPANVLISNTDLKNINYDKNLSIRTNNFIAKISDFEFATTDIPGLVNPVKFKIGYNKEYDIKTFLLGVKIIPTLHENVKKWISSLDTFIPSDILNENYFSSITI